MAANLGDWSSIMREVWEPVYRNAVSDAVRLEAQFNNCSVAEMEQRHTALRKAARRPDRRLLRGAQRIARRLSLTWGVLLRGDPQDWDC